MKRSLIAACMLALAAAIPAPAMSAEAADTSGFLSACNTNADFLANLEGDKEALAGLCTCVTDSFVTEELSQTDVDILAGDLTGETTDEQRQSYETYEDLGALAGDTLTACLES